MVGRATLKKNSPMKLILDIKRDSRYKKKLKSQEYTSMKKLRKVLFLILLIFGTDYLTNISKVEAFKVKLKDWIRSNVKI